MDDKWGRGVVRAICLEGQQRRSSEAGKCIRTSTERGAGGEGCEKRRGRTEGRENAPYAPTSRQRRRSHVSWRGEATELRRVTLA